ncbi:hypothetical protein BDY24DRAFT_440332 [Mrakia frigida]|uniref:endonuclease n=1 Tax=Mrakia frigida TaxID=29902 RepID=UPI003FCC0805
MPPKTDKIQKEYAQPRFYACYLLRPVNVGSFRTYVGSTPDPPRRIRQHNGEIKGGAVYTRKFKPWHMEMIIYGFPSKLAALQFEWCWIHPEKSRHLRHPPGTVLARGRKKAPISTSAKPALPPPLFPRNKNSNRPESKVAVARKMLTLTPYNRLPLHVRLFSTTAVSDWQKAGEKEGVRSLNKHTTVESTFGGVDGKRVVGGRNMGKGEAIEVDDYTFGSKHYQSYLSFLTDLPSPTPRSHSCSLCPSPIDLSSPLLHAFCSTCHTTTHLVCLSSHFLTNSRDKSSVLPTSGTCPAGCGWEGEWGLIVRGCWAVKRGTEGTLEALRKKGRGGKRKVAEEEEEEESEEEEGGMRGEQDESQDMLSRPSSPPPQRSLATLLSTVGLTTPPKKQRVNTAKAGPSRSQIPVVTPPKPSRKPAPAPRAKPKTTSVQKKKVVQEYIDLDDEEEEDDGEESEGVIFERLMGMR